MERAFNFSTIMPRRSFLECHHRFLKLEFQGTTESFVRVLERIMRTEVPTIAIDFILFDKNDSYLSDGFLAHRLFLIPLISDLEILLYYPTDCPNCKGRNSFCHLCSFEFSLSAKCFDVQALDLTSKNLVCSNQAVIPFDYRDTMGTVIGTLLPGEEVELTAIAKKGIGKDEAKWSPVKTLTYISPVQIRINEEMMETLTLEQKKEWVAICPTFMFYIDRPTEKVVLTYPEAYYYDDMVTRKAVAMGKPGLVEMCEKKDTFMFTVETTGAFGASQLLMKAIKILKKKAAFIAQIGRSLYRI